MSRIAYKKTKKLYVKRKKIVPGGGKLGLNVTRLEIEYQVHLCPVGVKSWLEHCRCKTSFHEA